MLIETKSFKNLTSNILEVVVINHQKGEIESIYAPNEFW